MKQILLSLVFLLPATMFSAPLSGVYTVGGSSPSYATLTAAASAVNTNGVSGPVTFNIRAGTYNETFTVNNISGASTANNICFQSESGIASSVIITHPSSTVTLNGSRYVTFKNLTINGTANPPNSGSTTSATFVLEGNCNTDSIINCVLTAPIAPWTDYTFVINASQGTNDNIVVSGCQITGGGFGYETEGGGTNCGPILYNNIWTNQTYMAIDLLNTNYTVMQGNTITSNCVTTPQYSGPVTGSRFGIILWNGCHNVQIVENKIYGSIGEGMYVPTIGGTNFLVANNFVQADIGIDAAYAEYYSFLNNSFYTTSYGIDFWYECYNNIVENNIFYNSTGTGIFTLDSTADFTICDYNAYYTTGNFATAAASGSYSTFAAWQAATGFDTHSRVVLPSFVSSSDLHLTNYTPMRFGTSLNAVTIDFDYTVRGSSPTVGADDNGTIVSIPNIPCCGCSPEAFSANVTTVCSGSNVQFTDQTGSSAIGWQWLFAGGTPGSSSSQNPLVTYDTSGTYNVTLIMTTSSGKDTLTKASYIKVNAVPAAGSITANPDSVCAGNSSQLTVTGSSGSIQWQSSSSGNNFADISGANSTAYNTPALSQTTNYRLIVTNGSCADTSTALSLVVNPNPIPPVLSVTDSMICASDSALITTSGSYSSYLWNNGDNRSYTYANVAGGYWLTVTDANGCTAISNHQDISVFPVPSVSIIVQGDTLSSFGATSYQWYFNDTAISNATSPRYIVNQSGFYSVEITDTNGCKALSNNTQVVITGITQPGENNLLIVYPNPFTKSIFVSADNIKGIEVFDVTGRIVFNESYITVKSRVEINLADLKEGVYFLKTTTEQGESVNKIVKYF